MTRYYSPAMQMGIGYEFQNDFVSSIKELRDNYNGSTSYMFRWLDEIDYDTRGRPKDAFPVARSSPYALHFVYDNAKQQLTDFSWHNGEIFDLHYDYDAVDNVSKVEDQHTGAGVNGTLDFDHDARDRLKWWQRPAQATQYMNYDVLGNPVGKDVASPSTQNQTFGHATNPYAITARPGVTYGYNADGDQTTRASGGTTHYRTYDSEGRLRCVGTTQGSCNVQSFNYRFDGQRLTEKVGGRTRILGPEGFTLDIEADASVTARFYSYAFGSVLSETTQTLTVLRSEEEAAAGWWLPLDRLAPLLAAALAAGLLVALVRLGVVESLRAHPVQTTIALVTAVALIPIPAAFATPPLPGGGTTTRVLFLGDQVGSSLVAVTVTDPPTVVSRRVFDPFGKELAHDTTGQPVPRTFAGQRHVEGANLYDFQARWYDHETGRFAQVDPLVEALGDPGTVNAYTYVRNNPTSRIDPTGTQSFGEAAAAQLDNQGNAVLTEFFHDGLGQGFTRFDNQLDVLNRALSQQNFTPVPQTNWQLPNLTALGNPSALPAAGAPGSRGQLTTLSDAGASALVAYVQEFGIARGLSGFLDQQEAYDQFQCEEFGFCVQGGGGSFQLIAGPGGPIRAASLFRNALGAFGGGSLRGGSLTNAGRALTKHPELVGLTKQSLRRSFRTDAQLNAAASSALKGVFRQGVLTTPTLSRYGPVIQIQIPGGFGARFSGAGPTFGKFIGFIGP